MNVQQVADLGPSGVLVQSDDPKRLGFKLQQILGTRDCFASSGIVSGGIGSMRIFFANPKEGADDFLAEQGRPDQIAHQLMEAVRHNQARYPDQSKGRYRKGWAIRSVLIDGRCAAIAEAVWV